jgi:hypothetical protein
MKQPPIKSTHLDDTVQAIARLRADHDQKGTPLERTVDRPDRIGGLRRPGERSSGHQ